MKLRTRPIQNAEAACTLPMPDLMPEDIAFDKLSSTFVVSSIQHHTLYRVLLPQKSGRDCALKEIPVNESAKRWPTLAVSMDQPRHRLWFTASAMPDFTSFPKGDERKASLFAMDGTSGNILQRFDLAEGHPAVMGDMSVAQDGTVYVSDSIGGGVYRVQGDLKTAKLEKIGGDFFSPQTPGSKAAARNTQVLRTIQAIRSVALRPMNFQLPPNSAIKSAIRAANVF